MSGSPWDISEMVAESLLSKCPCSVLLGCGERLCWAGRIVNIRRMQKGQIFCLHSTMHACPCDCREGKPGPIQPKTRRPTLNPKPSSLEDSRAEMQSAEMHVGLGTLRGQVQSCDAPAHTSNSLTYTPPPPFVSSAASGYGA